MDRTFSGARPQVVAQQTGRVTGGTMAQPAAHETADGTTARIRLWRVDAIVGGTLFALLLLSLAGTFVTYSSASAGMHKLAKLFLFEEEKNLPTLFNVFLLIADMVALGTVAMFRFASGDRWRWHWLSLAAIFLFLSYDEAAQVHERLNGVMAGVVDARGFLAFAWVVPALAFVLVVGLAFSRFLLNLPRRRAVLFVLAGALYVGGAVGVEMIGADLWSLGGWDNVTYSLVATFEETLEMSGLIVFLHATLGVLAGPDGVLWLTVGGAGPGAA